MLAHPVGAGLQLPTLSSPKAAYAGVREPLTRAEPVADEESPTSQQGCQERGQRLDMPTEAPTCLHRRGTAKEL